METVTEVKEARLLQLPSLHSAVSFRPALKQLQRQRKETAALRDLFHSLVDKRQRIQQLTTHADLTSKLGLPVSSAERLTNPPPPPTTTSLSGRKPQTIQQGRAANCGGPDEGVAVEAKASLPPITPPSQPTAVTKEHTQNDPRPSLVESPLRKTKAPIPQTFKKISKNRRQENLKSPLPYHTAITRRPVRTCSPRFQALTHFCRSPMPHLMEGAIKRSYTDLPNTKRGLQEWQNEIIKIVPSRPDFAQPLGQSAMPARTQTFRYPYKVINFDPTCHFYRSWSRLYDKDYVISPEWSSEKRHLRNGVLPQSEEKKTVLE